LILKDVTGPEVSQMTYSNLMGTATGRDFPFLQIRRTWPWLHTPSLLSFQLLQSCSPVENQTRADHLKTFFFPFFFSSGLVLQIFYLQLPLC